MIKTVLVRELMIYIITLKKVNFFIYFFVTYLLLGHTASDIGMHRTRV